MASALLRRSTSRVACSGRLHFSPSHRLSSPFIPRRYNSSSTTDRFTSIHGERPSSEYAKQRKESLESEFGEILGARSKSLFAYRRVGPFLALYRAAIVSFEVTKLTFWHFLLKDVHKRAEKFSETLIRLGPFYIKLGQALSTRPDILPSAYCKELSKLQDQIPPFSTRVAMKSIERQLEAPVSEIFADISPQPVAAASLGQVYKAHLKSGELVAVKVQRPGMTPSLTLDALLFQMIGGQLKRFATARKDLLVAVNEMVRHMFNEIDYILEAQNADRFAALYSSRSAENNWRQEPSIKVPKIYWKYTRKAVLTMEWVDGIKLTDSERINKANLNRKALIDQGVYCSLRQLLEDGFFHADPHPGNLVVTKEGCLAYFDFGMMGDIPRHYRVGLIQVLVHFVNRDSLGLANDFHSLGFVPEGTDLRQVADALRYSFGGSGTRQSNDFQGIMSQLYDVMYEFNFSLPPDYALVIRALGSLEGTAKALDPGFKVVESAYPFVIGRLLADPNKDMRRILRELLFRNDGSIRWNRLERLVVESAHPFVIGRLLTDPRNDGSVRWNRLERLIAAISEQTSEPETTDGTQNGTETKNRDDSKSGTETKNRDNSKSGTTHGWKSFDMRSVVASTEDLFNFILSEKGRRVRVFLIQDILKASDAFLQDLASPCFFDKTETLERDPNPESAMINRVIKGIKSLREAVRLAPEIWTAMFIRIMIKPEMNGFLFHVFRALESHSRFRIPETCWLCVSRFLHYLEEKKQHGI